MLTISQLRRQFRACAQFHRATPKVEASFDAPRQARRRLDRANARVEKALLRVNRARFQGTQAITRSATATPTPT